MRANSKDKISFREVVEGDIPLLFNWLNAPFVRGFYDDGYSSLEAVGDKYLSLREGVCRRVVYHDGKPFGYVQWYDVDHLHEYGSFVHGVEKTVGLDLFIGEFDYLGRGFGSLLLQEAIYSLGPEIGRVIVDPDVGNERSMALFSRYGFAPVKESAVLGIDIRKAVRGVVLNDKREVLLIHMKSDPEKFNQRGFDSFWLTPGGKVESSETQLEALVREIREETGITDLVVKQALFSDEKTLIWDGFPVRLFNHYYLVHTSESKIENTALVDYEKELILGYKWWTQKELSETKEVIFPSDLKRWLQNT